MALNYILTGVQLPGPQACFVDLADKLMKFQLVCACRSAFTLDEASPTPVLMCVVSAHHEPVRNQTHKLSHVLSLQGSGGINLILHTYINGFCSSNISEQRVDNNVCLTPDSS